jgi:hypothetical protein
MRRTIYNAIRLSLLALVCAASVSESAGTAAIALRSRYRIVLAADSRVTYSPNRTATECKLFEVRDVYATVAGLAHYGKTFRATDAINDGFARPGSFQNHLSATAYSLRQGIERLLSSLRQSNASAYRSLWSKSSQTADFVQLAVAQSVNGRPMLGMIELRRASGQTYFTTQTTVCPGNCDRNEGVFYMGYWERIEPYVADAGQPRTIASAASIDRLIRMEMDAHPAEVGAPINILELNGSGARWLQNGGNCSLPGVGW